MYDVIILAGGKSTDALKSMTQTEYEALIDIAGVPMVAHVARTFENSKNIGQIFVIGPQRELEKIDFSDKVKIYEGGSTLLETIQIGIKALGHTQKTLLATADIPLITTKAVEHFIEVCSLKEADLYYPVVAKEVHIRQYPNNKRTYVPLKEGTFTGGNLFMVNPKIVPNCLAFAEKVIKSRKSPLTLCRLLGFGVVFSFLFRRLTIARLEAKVSEMLGITGTVIKTPYPEIGIDVDKPTDLKLVQALVRRG